MNIREFTLEDYERLNANMFAKPYIGSVKVSYEQWNVWTNDSLKYSELDVIVDSMGITLVGNTKSVYLEMIPSKALALVRGKFTNYMTINALKLLGFVNTDTELEAKKIVQYPTWGYQDCPHCKYEDIAMFSDSVECPECGSLVLVIDENIEENSDD